MDDLLIIGAGPIGIACGIEAKKNNLKYTIIDKGCLVNSLYNYPLNMTFFSTSDRLEIGEIPLAHHSIEIEREGDIELDEEDEGFRDELLDDEQQQIFNE